MIKEKLIDKIKTNDSKAIEKLLKRAQQIKDRGINDDDIVAQLVADEYKAGYKTPTILAAGMYDKMNHMCRSYMDRTVRFSLYYDFVPDIDTLRNVIGCLMEKSPIMHSKFWDNHIVPFWIVSDYHIDDVFQVIETDDFEKSIYEYSVKSVDVKSNVQIKIILFVKDDKSAIFFWWNHMVFDGGAFKQLAKDITENYNRFIKGEKDKITFRTGTRKYSRVYEDMPNGNKAKLKFKKTFARDKKMLPYTKKSKDDKVYIVKRSVPADVLKNIVAAGKECGGTINDVFAAAYLRACYRLIGCDKNESMLVSCAMDLRRYIKDIDTIGYTNHTNFMPCISEKMGDSMRDTIRDLAKSTKALKADEFNGLHGLPLLNIGYSTMLYFQAELVVKACYYNANMQLTNIGFIGGEKYQFDGHEVVDAFLAASAKYKPTSAVCVYTVADKMVFTQPLIGNAEDRKISEKLFDYIEEELRSL